VSDDFAQFYSLSFKRVALAARAFCRDVDVADDAAQEAFARAYSRWSRVRKTSFPEAWVMTTALNLTKRHFRRRSREARATNDASVPGPSGDRTDLLVALRLLPERQREAVVLHYLGDIPIYGVAEAMGVSQGTVKAHLNKARSALRAPLEIRDA
jgi:RNA polymerase sigma-70 factor, ECF subfamily